jgi:heme/copper-type cytochrome/quinol oxidase subunit 4
VTGSGPTAAHRPDPGAAPAGPAHAGVRTYVVVAAILLILTVMEVVVFYIPALRGILVPVLIVLALAKFALVAMFYMHLRFDSPWFSYLLVFPLIVATGLVLTLLWLFHHLGRTG